MSTPESLAWQPYNPCPCGCGTVGWKLRKNGHVVGCGCPSCRNRRNQKKGRVGQANAHKALGGAGFTPHHEESGRTYSVEIQAEVKKGAQVPAALTKLVSLDWTRRALSQADRAIPEGVQAFPAVYMEPPGGGAWLLVEIRPPRNKKGTQ